MTQPSAAPAPTGASPTRANGHGPGGLVLGRRAFWSVFAGAWLAYGGIFLLAALMQGEGLGQAGLGALISVLAPGLPSLYLVRRRRRLLDGSESWKVFIGRRVAEAVAFTATTSALAATLMWVCSLEPAAELGREPAMLAVAWTVNGLFLYAVVTAFLMWTESLERVQETRTLVAREAVLRAQAEAKALRAQFNPHFVFNTLHSLMLLVRAEPDAAERAIDDVAELIRYASTLQRREIDQVSLAKELAFVERYVSLERLRLAERLTVRWEVDGGLEDLLVPAFALQTLLENAIKHGISTRSEGGTVTIRGWQGDGMLSLEISDDGIGADPARIGGDGGSGLRLLARRLEAVYRGSASLAWRTAPGEGFVATVTVPARRAAAPATG